MKQEAMILVQYYMLVGVLVLRLVVTFVVEFEVALRLKDMLITELVVVMEV